MTQYIVNIINTTNLSDVKKFYRYTIIILIRIIIKNDNDNDDKNLLSVLLLN